METNSNKTTATVLHLSTLTQYCIPFGNFIIPIIIWSSKREKSEYLDAQGKQVINFQLSVLMYSLILALIAIPTILATILSHISINEISNHHNLILENFQFENFGLTALTGITAIIILLALKTIEFLLVILAAVKASNGEYYKYPFTIEFLK